MPCAKLLEIECWNCELLPNSTDLMWQTDSLRLRLRDVGLKATAALCGSLEADQNLTLRRTQRHMTPSESDKAAGVYDYVEVYKRLQRRPTLSA